MLSNKEISILSILIIVNSIFSINQWSILPIGNTFTTWIVNALIIAILCKGTWNQRNEITKGSYVFCTLFLIWALIGSIRGFFVASNYWEYKQLVEGIFCLSLPLFAYAFANDDLDTFILRKWNRWMVPIFVLFIIWVIPSTGYHFCIWPIFLYGIFASYLPARFRIGLVIVLVAMATVGISARAQLIKVVFTILFGFAFYYRSYWMERIVHIMHYVFYLGGISLLVLGITGRFNLFEMMESEKGVYTEVRVDSEGNKVIEDASADTRTFIYQEVISSAILNDYVWTGRTPARGNDSFMFGKDIAEDTGTNRFERHTNEVCHPNIFTWLGLIGMLLYCCIYFQASWLALHRSNSYALKLIGCFVAFHWAMGWIEDQNRFDVSNIFLWMCIAMCLSEKFRAMDDDYFYAWFYCIFHNAEIAEEEDVDDEEDSEFENNEQLTIQ